MAGAAVALFAIVTLGNLRLSASEVRAEPEATVERGVPDSVQFASGNDRLFGTDVDGDSVTASRDGADRSAGEESLQVVPAIYAWDPDVRFVYYRHVSKWM